MRMLENFRSIMACRLVGQEFLPTEEGNAVATATCHHGALLLVAHTTYVVALSRAGRRRRLRVGWPRLRVGRPLRCANGCRYA